MFVAVNSARSSGALGFSEKRKFLWNPMCQTFVPGPMTTPRAAFPKRPSEGAAKAPAANQPSMVRLEMLGSRNWSGRILTRGRLALVVKLVPVGSGIEIVGVRNIPDWK